MEIVAINGSLRQRSSSAALSRALAHVAPDGVTVTLYRDLGELPHFNPDLDEEGLAVPSRVDELRRLLRDADAIYICSPEYAHGVPGVLKNMLDWLVSDGTLVGKPVALLNPSPAGGTYAQASLVETLRTMNWNVVEAASHLEPFVTRRITGEVEDEATLHLLRASIETMRQAVRR